MEALRLYLKLIRISMQARMQYRADFITGMIGVIVLNVVNLGLIGILVSRFTHLNGWTIWEMVFFYCLWILGREFQFLGVADLFFGVSGASLAYTALGLRWDWVKWMFFGLAIVSGTLIETTLALMIACIAFWTGRSRRVHSLVVQLNVMVQHYPVDIFGYTFRVIVTGLIPVAFMNYYPALMLLDKLDRNSEWWG